MSDRTTEFAQAVSDALDKICAEWRPDEAKHVRINNLYSAVNFKWAGSMTTYTVRIDRVGTIVPEGKHDE